ncbi:hypothetical protein ACFVU2_19795 [Leifsonia sp. NPDC058194]|uniref:hypothetical protein n=1 Tax=Leifsonia sp. NPDC058194 TaxID=3346374 RepID=UPI0036DEA202
MTKNDTLAPVATSTVQALVTLTVAPKEGQSTTAAAEEMLELFRQYLITREHPFLSDYGATLEEVAAYHAGDAEGPVWGGYEGPFVLDVAVQGVAPVGSEEA